MDFCKIWDSAFPRSKEATCPICNHIWMDRTRTIYKPWIPAHCISPCHGGSDDKNNLIPICWQCERDRGQRNVVDYAITQNMPYNKKILQRGNTVKQSCIIA